MSTADVARALAEYQQHHEDAHAKIGKQLNFILHEVQANGRKGLQASLEDIYTALKKLDGMQAQLAEVHTMLQPEARRIHALHAIKEWASGSSVLALFRAKLVRTTLYVVGVLLITELLRQVFGLDTGALLRLFGGGA